MAKVIINNIECEGDVGERLVDIARRHAAHIGFLCDGVGAFLIESSACRVLRGAEHLNPPTDVEKNWLQESWLEAGHRLACQVTLTGSGPVEILSRAEELRRQTFAVFTPPEGTSAGENAGLLINNMSRIMMNQVLRFPSNMMSAFTILTKPSPQQQDGQQNNVFSDIQKMVNDGSRVVQSLIGGTPEQTAAQQEQTGKKRR